MQNTNRIQNVTINTNATILGVLVVGGMNAHRAYHSSKPCDPSPFQKGSEPMARSSMRMMHEQSQRCSPFAQRRTAMAGAYAAEGTWRLLSRASQTLANIDAAHDFKRKQRD